MSGESAAQNLGTSINNMVASLKKNMSPSLVSSTGGIRLSGEIILADTSETNKEKYEHDILTDFMNRENFMEYYRPDNKIESIYQAIGYILETTIPSEHRFEGFESKILPRVIRNAHYLNCFMGSNKYNLSPDEVKAITDTTKSINKKTISGILEYIQSVFHLNMTIILHQIQHGEYITECYSLAETEFSNNYVGNVLMHFGLCDGRYSWWI